MSKTIRTILLIIIVGALSGAFSSYLLIDANKKQTKQKLIKNFYDTETAVHVSPHGLRKQISKGDNNFILVDLRSQVEYEKEHIVGAISIPAYKDPDTSAYGDVDRIVKAFSELDKNKDIVVYCYSMPCLTGRKIGQMLAEHDIYVKHLAIGWNEWRYYWNLWNHEHEWEITNVENYTSSGGEPGQFVGDDKGEENNVCPIENEFGC